MRPEFIVAEKEFKDHLSSKRFIAIFAILALLAFAGVYMGMDNYEQKLEMYKNPQLVTENAYTKMMIDAYQTQISDAEARGDSPEHIQSLKDQLSSLTNPAMPSVLEVFSSMVILFTFVGMILGAALGFDQISREKDEGSLKFLAISPIHRDAIINGKTLGALATLSLALAAAFILAIAVVMIRGVVPGLDDMVRIAAFYVASLLYCMVFFAIAMMMSALTRNTAVSVICTIGLVFLLVFFSIFALIASSFIAQSIVGPAPPINYADYMDNSTGSMNVTSIMADTEYMNYTNKLVTTQFQISDTLTTVSPVNDFGGLMGLGMGGVGQAILSKTPVQTFDLSLYGTAPKKQISLLESLASVWTKILVLLVELVAALVISYMVFMRIDIR